MSFDGQVLCQRMLIGPWALTTVGAATAVAALAAATFRKRRRVEVLSLVGLVMEILPVEPVLWSAGILLAGTLEAGPELWQGYVIPVRRCGAGVGGNPLARPMAPAR